MTTADWVLGCALSYPTGAFILTLVLFAYGCFTGALAVMLAQRGPRRK